MTLTGEVIVGLFLLLMVGVASGNLLGEFLFRLMNPDDGGDE